MSYLHEVGKDLTPDEALDLPRSNSPRAFYPIESPVELEQSFSLNSKLFKGKGFEDLPLLIDIFRPFF